MTAILRSTETYPSHYERPRKANLSEVGIEEYAAKTVCGDKLVRKGAICRLLQVVNVKVTILQIYLWSGFS